MRFVGSILLLFAFLGCGSHKNHATPSEVAHKQKYEGKIADAFEQMYKLPDIGTCDLKFKNRMLAIAKILDEKQDLIQQAYKSQTPNVDGKKIPTTQVGKYTFLDFDQKPEHKSWFERRYGWGDLLTALDRGKRDLSNPEDLAMIDDFVRSILPDELDRLDAFLFPGLNRKNLPLIQEIFKKVETCFNAQCTTLELTAEEEQLLKLGWFHRNAVKYFREEHDFKYLKALYKHMKSEVEKYNFEKNVNMAQVSPGKFVLKMASGDFAGGEADFSKFLKYWHSDKNQVVIEPATGLSGLFRFVIGQVSGGRAFVDRNDKSLNINEGEYLKAIAHEFGHVLGFRDEYYTSYDFNECKYVNELNDIDIMSNHMSGHVQDSHWKKLSEVYPVVNQ
jgi:hypothetical protein